MANIISQITFFDHNEIEILGDLERLVLALEGIEDENLMCMLEKRRGKGRNDYPVRVMWNLVIAMKVFGHQSVSSFIRECRRNAGLRKVCGLIDWKSKKHLVPPERVFSGFLKLLSEYQSDVDNIFVHQVGELYDNILGFGDILAGDGKYLDSYAKKRSEESTATDNRTENDAEYSKKEYHYTNVHGKKCVKTETHFGFKAHILCDVNSELPIAFIVTKANFDEKKAMEQMLVALSTEQKARAKHLLLDRGYDSLKMIQFTKQHDICPIVDIRNMWRNGESTKQYKNTDIVYNAHGEVFFVDNNSNIVKMKYKGYDKQKDCLRYEHKGSTYRIYVKYDERIFLPIARDSAKFKRLYKGRTAVERLNGRIDRDYLFERHQIRGLAKMRLMVSISLIVMNGMAVGKTKRKLTGIRSLTTAA